MKLSKRWLGVSVAALVAGGGALTAVTASAATTPVWTASCPDHGSTSAAGCGSWDAAPSSGQAPGFLTGQQSSPDLIDVNQDPWSGSQGPQSISASSYQDWSLTATDTQNPDSPGAVLTYPDTSFNYAQLGAPLPSGYDLDNITSLTSSYSETMPAVADTYTAEGAYDTWLNNTAGHPYNDNWDVEVMVWYDVHYQDVNCGSTSWDPSCSGDSKVGTYAIDGQSWTLWKNGTGFYLWELNQAGVAADAVSQPSGTVDLKAMYSQMVSNGELSPSAAVAEIENGWEIADTAGNALTWNMNSLSVDINGSVTPPPTPTPTPTTPTPTPTPTTPTPTPTPTVTGPVLSAGTAVSGASWKSTVTPGTWKVTLSGPGKLNGTSQVVSEPDVLYPDSSLSEGHTYTATVQQEVNGAAAGSAGKVTFIAG